MVNPSSVWKGYKNQMTNRDTIFFNGGLVGSRGLGYGNWKKGVGTNKPSGGSAAFRLGGQTGSRGTLDSGDKIPIHAPVLPPH